jgi:1-deoxy-D-xylulose-5-phosphate reductoisomerase
MNKALEMIEAYHLFPVEADQIDAIIHPQSIIHSLVHYRDGSVLAQLGMPDMRIPIAHTLGWPKRLAVNTPTLSLSEIGTLEFAEPDVTRFPALRLVRDVMAGEQSLSIAFNAANEVAVAAFLAKRLPFIGITELVEKILDKTSNNLVPSIEDALYLDEEIREKTKELLSS